MELAGGTIEGRLERMIGDRWEEWMVGVVRESVAVNCTGSMRSGGREDSRGGAKEGRRYPLR